MSFDQSMYLVPLMGLIGLLYTIWKFFWVSKQDAGTDRMKEISNYISDAPFGHSCISGTIEENIPVWSNGCCVMGFQYNN